MGKASRRKAEARMQNVLATAKGVIQKIGGAKEVRVRDTLPQEEKISHSLSLLLESEVPPDSPLEEYKAVLSLIVAAWNFSLLDADTRPGELREFIETLSKANESMRRDLLTQIERLVVRKQVLFPEDRRTIVSWDVRFQGDFVRISAAALTRDA